MNRNVADEFQLMERIQTLANQNQVWRTYIGMGYYNCHVPHPILRNLFENPGWCVELIFQNFLKLFLTYVFICWNLLLKWGNNLVNNLIKTNKILTSFKTTIVLKGIINLILIYNI